MNELHRMIQALPGTWFLSVLTLLLWLSASAAIAEQSTSVTYYHTDVLGSVFATSDEFGQLNLRDPYRPFGESQAITPDGQDRHGYVGKSLEPSGLIYLGARYYDPHIGRFMGMDPASVINHIENNPMMFNRYAYANNNPYRYIDPTGEIPIDTAWDAANIVYDIGKISVGWWFSNEKLILEGSVDLASDLTALATPYLPAGATKVLGIGAKQVTKRTANFADKAKLTGHFDKHGTEFGAKTADEYLSIAQDVMKNGTKVQYSYKGETRTGFVQLMGTNRKGQSKFAFVGTNNQGQITTLHTKSGKDFWKTLNGNANDKTIYPVP